MFQRIAENYVSNMKTNKQNNKGRGKFDKQELVSCWDNMGKMSSSWTV